jgi:hypothetical protein
VTGRRNLTSFVVALLLQSPICLSDEVQRQNRGLLQALFVVPTLLNKAGRTAARSRPRYTWIFGSCREHARVLSGFPTAFCDS